MESPWLSTVLLREISGEYYALQDADDLSSPRRIEALVGCMEENPDVAAVYSGYELVMNERRMAPTFRHKDRAACARRYRVTANAGS